MLHRRFASRGRYRPYPLRCALSCAIVTLLLSLRWDAPAEASLLHSIELSFVVFAVLCVLGIVPSLARRAAKSAPPEER